MILRILRNQECVIIECLFFKALLLDIYFYNRNINLSKYHVAGNLFDFIFFFVQNLKNSIFVSMTTIEATSVKGLFQLLILEGY